MSLIPGQFRKSKTARDRANRVMERNRALKDAGT